MKSDSKRLGVRRIYLFQNGGFGLVGEGISRLGWR